MKKLEELNRYRCQKLYLLLPEEIAKKHISPFFISSYEPTVDFDAITLDKYQPLIDEMRNSLKSLSRRALANVVKANRVFTKPKDRLRIESIDSATRSRKGSRDLEQPSSSLRQSTGQSTGRMPPILKASTLSKSTQSKKDDQQHVKAIPIKFDPTSPRTTALYDKGCIGCGK
jgi:hypothetical protein